MKTSDFEKYITGLPPELQEQARQCADAEELNKLLAENEVELSEEALAAVAGGCSVSNSEYEQGDATSYKCRMCGANLRYWDQIKPGQLTATDRLYCANPGCDSYNRGLWYLHGDQLTFIPR